MNIEVLTPENRRYLEQYKTLGFKNEIEMINEALVQLRNFAIKKQKRSTLLEAGQDYARDNDYAWDGLDGDDFEN